MSNEKISVSWDEVHATGIDVQLKQAEAQGRAQTQFERQFSTPPPLTVSSRGKWIYQTVAYMTLFGALGGVAAAIVGEVVQVFKPTEMIQYLQVLHELDKYRQAAGRGELTQEQFDQISDRALSFLAAEKNRYAKPYLDPQVSQQDHQRLEEAMMMEAGGRILIVTLLWYCAVASMISMFLASAEPLVEHNYPGFIKGAAAGLGLGLLAGGFIGILVEIFYTTLRGGSANSIIGQVFARAATWGLLGMFLGLACGLVARSGKKVGVCLLGGLIGGILGGALFDPVYLMVDNDLVSRAIGVFVIGTTTGLATGLIENAIKTGWLKVAAGLIAGKQFVLYRNTTYIGSSPQCEIYLFKDTAVSPRHAAIHIVGGGFDIEDIQSSTGTIVNGRPVRRARLRPNDQIQIGSTVLVFQQKEKGHS